MPAQAELKSGPAAASILAAGAGCFLMGVFYVLGNASTVCNRMFSIYKPAGALSGVSTATIVAWLLLWAVLDRRWKERDVATPRIGLWSFLLLLVVCC